MFVPAFNSAVMLKSAFPDFYFPLSIPVPYQCHSSLQAFSAHVAGIHRLVIWSGTHL